MGHPVKDARQREGLALGRLHCDPVPRARVGGDSMVGMLKPRGPHHRASRAASVKHA